MSQEVVTRFAPSPTGLLHVGNYRTAVFAYLFARKQKGKFLLRIEDTDKQRSKKEFEDNILESLAWIGLEYDELYRQSELIEKHTRALEKLVEQGIAYVSKELAKDESGEIRDIIRFRNPNKEVIFHDIIRGSVTMDTSDLGDFVIAKNMTEPVFHFANVIDDYSMGVTHIIRGEDHISNTPRQILIGEALGAPTPTYAHLPLVLAEDRSKLSKRKGAKALTEYRDMGYLPDAVLNTMALIGWNPGGEQEIFSKDELISLFDLSKVQKGSAIFNQEKLDWINREHIKKLSEKDFGEHAKKFLGERKVPPELFAKLTSIFRERISSFSDIPKLLDDELHFLSYTPNIETEMLAWKTATLPETGEYLRSLVQILTETHRWSKESIEENVMKYAHEHGKGNVLWPLRYALTGQKTSPDPFTCLVLLGRDEAMKRIRTACAKIL